MVSIIIPVYETESFLNKCIDSVLSQTCKDIEIVFVIASGRDNSEVICEEYSKIDSRIRIVNQIGNGAGNARNQGVSIAQGEFICFVDSDDWVEPDFVEKLLGELQRSESDIVECDYFWGENGVERIGGNSPYNRIDPNLLRVCAAPACWKQMYRKDFLEKKHLQFANTVAEDLFLYSDMYRVCKKSAFIEEPLYHYRIRSGSFTDSATKDAYKYKELISLFGMIVERYRKRNYELTAFEELKRQITPHATIRYRKIASRTKKDTAQELWNQSNKFFSEIFENPANPFSRKVIAVGGYNLGRISNYFSADKISNIRFSFSSLISAMSQKDDNISVSCENEYRQNMILKDIGGVFVKSIESFNPDLLLIDFLEERFDIIIHNDCYYTYSDAFMDSQHNLKEFNVISRMSANCDILWERSCNSFVELIERLDERCDVVLVENYLSEGIGNIYKRDDTFNHRVRELNSKLKKYYCYLEEKCKRIKVIRWNEIPDILKYTDEQFEHGVKPEHLNQYYYSYVANCIFDLLGERA